MMKAEIKKWRKAAEDRGYTFTKSKRGPHVQCRDAEGRIVFGLSSSPHPSAYRAIRADFHRINAA